MIKAEGNKFRVVRLAAVAALVCVLVMCTVISASAASTVTQSDWCLSPSAYTSVVDNKDFHVNSYKYGAGKRDEANVIETSQSDGKKVTFKTKYLLPINFKTPRWSNPQSMAMDENTGYLYVLYTTKADSNTGWIARYDTKKLAKNKISYKDLATAKLSGDSALEKKMRDCIKYGPQFTTGHGQSLSFNPVTKELWEIKDTSMSVNPGAYATVQRINKSTLKPDAAIKFRLKSTVTMGHNLTFDSSGNAYFYTYTGSGEFEDSLKIYKGWISTSAVNFELIPQGLKNSPGSHSQGIGYNPVSDRLVFVADGCISSVPVDKLGHLSPSDVWQTKFKTNREFESVTFDKDGHAYLLTNRGPEIFRSTGVY
ncbi:MAG: hypothetical protein LBJ91_03890 [Clostridiales Family XIII bacterium]|jgi:hypothetical protein|nr:hypothetical protein [Clostridiales Family XIII bacterium]